jgi:hypothetical protein
LAESTSGISVTRSDSLAVESTRGLSVTEPDPDSELGKLLATVRKGNAQLGISEAQFQAWLATPGKPTERRITCAECKEPLNEHEAVVFAHCSFGSSHIDLHVHCAEPYESKGRRKQCVHCGRLMIFDGKHYSLSRKKNACTPYCSEQYHLSKTRLTPREKICASCQKSFLPRRNDAVTCSNACRQRLHRQRLH